MEAQGGVSGVNKCTAVSCNDIAGLLESCNYPRRAEGEKKRRRLMLTMMTTLPTSSFSLFFFPIRFRHLPAHSRPRLAGCGRSPWSNLCHFSQLRFVSHFSTPHRDRSLPRKCMAITLTPCLSVLAGSVTGQLASPTAGFFKVAQKGFSRLSRRERSSIGARAMSIYLFPPPSLPL